MYIFLYNLYYIIIYIFLLNNIYFFFRIYCFMHMCPCPFIEYACIYVCINTQSFYNFRAFEEDAEQFPQSYQENISPSIMSSLKEEYAIKCHPHNHHWTMIHIKLYILPPIWLKNNAYQSCLIIAIIYTAKQFDFEALIKISGKILHSLKFWIFSKQNPLYWQHITISSSFRGCKHQLKYEYLPVMIFIFK